MGTRVSCAKTSEPTWMPFGKQAHVDPKKHVLDVAEILYRKKQFLGLFCQLKSIGSICCGACSITAAKEIIQSVITA